ncbi:MAG: hypothetical protein IJY23_01750 [Clostridia bacterium]|nr:hypothetical protein [Clostridia bacterium]
MFKRKNFFDKLFFLAFIFMLFALGFHLGKQNDGQEKLEAVVTINLEKSKGSADGSVLIDGKYECITISLDDNRLTLLCEGQMEEAGFLLLGAKYIAKNQPIKVSSDSGYFEGRIVSIDIKQRQASV